MSKFIPLILFTVLTNFLSQILLKKGMSGITSFNTNGSAIIGSVLGVVFNPFVFLGLVMMVVSMASHLYVLSKVDISFAYPFLGLSFALILGYGYFVLNEPVNSWRVLGVILICTGVALVARSA